MFNLNDIKKMTEAALMSALFVVGTIFFVSTGLGYTFYLDFIVPIFFVVICLKCDFKYSILAGVTSLVITGLVLGNIGTAIWASQSVILGIICGMLLQNDTTIMDDLVYGSILSVLLMVFVDIYASKLIGYSFMQEFKGYIKFLNNNEVANIMYYLLIAMFPFGMMFSVYYLGLIFSNKLKILKNNSKRKYNIIKNFRTYSRFIGCSKKVFYGCSIYLLIFQIFKFINIEINNTYLITISTCVGYLCAYFVVRDGYNVIQNYILSKYQKVSYARYMSLGTILILLLAFKVAIILIILFNTVLDKRIDIRVRQSYILDKLMN
ncbi:MAG TPA: YybS family protein [Romboutsia timonensis]|uniref:YybS family protein n=1 Tax=Romboutsia timonensis TaxID=1776391 RepID=A0A921N0B1_9FIRM|nr:DUF2232 domain-containing protein [uncultured Romboutsia sp.]HJG96020.1 YybS family protein [Romboutsia timonensis]